MGRGKKKKRAGQKRSTGFMDLPRELRNMVYRQALCPPAGLHLTSEFDDEYRGYHFQMLIRMKEHGLLGHGDELSSRTLPLKWVNPELEEELEQFSESSSLDSFLLGAARESRPRREFAEESDGDSGVTEDSADEDFAFEDSMSEDSMLKYLKYEYPMDEGLTDEDSTDEDSTDENSTDEDSMDEGSMREVPEDMEGTSDVEDDNPHGSFDGVHDDSDEHGRDVGEDELTEEMMWIWEQNQSWPFSGDALPKKIGGTCVYQMDDWAPNIDILLTNSTIYSEARAFLFSENVFTFDADPFSIVMLLKEWHHSGMADLIPHMRFAQNTFVKDYFGSLCHWTNLIKEFEVMATRGSRLQTVTLDIPVGNEIDCEKVDIQGLHPPKRYQYFFWPIVALVKQLLLGSAPFHTVRLLHRANFPEDKDPESFYFIRQLRDALKFRSDRGWRIKLENPMAETFNVAKDRCRIDEYGTVLALTRASEES